MMLLLIVLGSQLVIANTAQPGVWSAGGTGTFSLLFPEDTAAYKKIQMKQELVSIQLYPGFAIVKGEYWMYNAENYSITLKAGYPVNEMFEGQGIEKMEIRFDSLYKIRAKVDGQQVNISRSAANWYVWETTFKPQSYTKIEVYFLMNTNEAATIKGYERQEMNSFIYILQTGSTWKSAIEQGMVLFQLKGGLQMSEVFGTRPDSVFKVNEERKILLFQFENLVPKQENNLLVSYGKRIEKFDFQAIVKDFEQYFAEIDRLYPAVSGNSDNVFALSKSIKFEAKQFTQATDVSSGLPISWIVVFGVIIMVSLALIVGIIWVVVKIIRKVRNA